MTKRHVYSTPEPWFRKMKSDVAGGRYSEARKAYEEASHAGDHPSVEAQLLHARLLLKEDENRAVTFLLRHKANLATSEQSGLWSLLLGVGYARMRDFETADQYFNKARSLLKTPKDIAQLQNHFVRRLLLEGKIGDARRYLDEMPRVTSPEAKVDRELLRSFILSHEEQYIDEAQTLIATIHTIGNRRVAHLETWFFAVQNLAVLARELTSDEAATVARAQVDAQIEWPEDFTLQRFVSLKAVAWTRAIRGDMLGCFRYLRAAEPHAPNDAYRAILGLDRAHFARIIGEKHWADDEIAKAVTIAEDVDWNSTNGDERVGLLLLAEILAEGHPERARFYLARYRGLDRMRSPLHLFAFDHRIDGYHAYTEGVVKQATDDLSAEESLRRAWVIFDRIGYDWRAGRTALRLFQVTAKRRWLHLAEDKLEAYPLSWLANDLSAVANQAAPTKRLTPMQRKVLEMLCSRMSTAEIARSLELSPHTIRNHLKAAFKTYGVKTQASLVAEAVRCGDLSPAMLAGAP